MTNTSALECQDCGAELENALVGYCDACQKEHKLSVMRAGKLMQSRHRFRSKPQNFDTSALPLFGDGHLQADLF